MTNPINSVSTMFAAAGQGAHSLTLYMALVMEEVGEAFAAFRVTDGTHLDEVNPDIAETLSNLSKVLRTCPQLSVVVPDKAALLDAHLDSVWVHLGAALALLGGDPEKLQAAWSELHRSNVVDKQVDGHFVIDGTGKITKPAGWTAPDFQQFFDTTNLELFNGR